jgi:Mn-dependent DtxR family transcriptional regulator
MREKKNAKNRERGERKNRDVKQKFRALSCFFSRIFALKKQEQCLLLGENVNH